MEISACKQASLSPSVADATSPSRENAPSLRYGGCFAASTFLTESLGIYAAAADAALLSFQWRWADSAASPLYHRGHGPLTPRAFARPASRLEMGGLSGILSGAGCCP
ncbi:MAG: hypothetical protein IKI13_00810 [Bacteroidales bacterium]|nr:hypothetical protein [Bacteroidales bacterium]